MTREPLISYDIYFNYFPAIFKEIEDFDLLNPAVVTFTDNKGTITTHYNVNLIKKTIHYNDDDRIYRRCYDIIKQKSIIDGVMTIKENVESWEEDNSWKPFSGLSTREWNGYYFEPANIYHGKRILEKLTPNILDNSSR